MALPPYAKPFVPIAGQVGILQGRGMVVSSPILAAEYLKRLGYYRLSGYWYPFRVTVPYWNEKGRARRGAIDRFRPGTEFQHAVDLYVFDKRLRLLFLDAIERVEVALRVAVALQIGHRNPLAHRQLSELHGRFGKINPTKGKTYHQVWLDRLNEQESRSKDDFVKHFRGAYSTDLPIWISIELWDFGLLSMLFANLQVADQNAIGSNYGVPKGDMLQTWLRSINNVRNICAHHSRLWNRSPADQPSPPKPGQIPWLDHLAADRFAQEHLYAVAAVVQFLMRTTNPASSWATRLKDHFKTFPACPGVSVAQTSFPAGWEGLPLWN